MGMMAVQGAGGRMTLGSLFAGIGGLELGFEWAGFEVRWQVEREPFCRAVLAKHWPDVRRYEDVREVGAANLEPVDVIIGGFPCQDISDAGKRVGIGGERSGLWVEYARIVRELRPRFVVIENVRGLLVRGIDRVLGDLADLGYDAEWTCLRASDVGAPHKRERVFIVAYAESGGQRIERGATLARDGRHVDGGGAHLADTDRGGREREREPEPRRLEGASGDQPDGCRNGRAGTEAGMAVSDALRRERRSDIEGEPTARRDGTQGSGRDGLEHANAAGPDRWPARPGEPQHAWEPPRVLRRAQSGMGIVPDGVPPGLVRHRRRALAALGNAVVPHCAYLVALRVLELAEPGEGVA